MGFISIYQGKCTAGQEIDATDKKKCKDCPVDKYQTKELPLETDKCVPCQTGYGTAAAKSKLKTDCKRMFRFTYLIFFVVCSR